MRCNVARAADVQHRPDAHTARHVDFRFPTVFS
jgi:hypothetical protein